jgi:hypothetical protein
VRSIDDTLTAVAGRLSLPAEQVSGALVGSSLTESSTVRQLMENGQSGAVAFLFTGKWPKGVTGQPTLTPTPSTSATTSIKGTTTLAEI